MAFVYSIPKNQELLPSPSPFSTLLTLKENRNKIKVAITARCWWYSYSTGKTWYIHLLSEALPGALRQRASYENRYPSSEIDAIFAWIFPAMQHRLFVPLHKWEMRLSSGGKDCCNTPLLSSSGTAYSVRFPPIHACKYISYNCCSVRCAVIRPLLRQLHCCHPPPMSGKL